MLVAFSLLVNLGSIAIMPSPSADNLMVKRESKSEHTTAAEFAISALAAATEAYQASVSLEGARPIVRASVVKFLRLCLARVVSSGKALSEADVEHGLGGGSTTIQDGCGERDTYIM